MSSIINANNKDFVGVAIQYRVSQQCASRLQSFHVNVSIQLGAFGFLSSDEVYRFGTTNAGIRDQTFALQWVQSYIGLFGGNASAVTVSGESAGGRNRSWVLLDLIELMHPTAGSVMLQALAFGGNLGTSLFRQVSP